MGEILSAFFLIGSALAAWAFFLRDNRRPCCPGLRGRLSRLSRLVCLRLGFAAPDPTPLGRPIETIAADLRRLAVRYRCPQEGARFAKVEGYRRAYDNVLIEACAALDLATLLPVLSPGRELDLERERVEHRLDEAGISPGIWL